MLGFLATTKKVFFSKNYAKFRGRASRSEYWFSILAYALIQNVLSLILIFTMNFTTEENINNFYYLVIYFVSVVYFTIPILSVSCRRMHDLNRSSTWLHLYLLPTVNLFAVIFFQIMFCLKGTNGPNRFGEDPNDQTKDFKNSCITLRNRTDYTKII